MILKILGGFILAVAHKTLIRAARDEGTGWWIATFLIPGAAIAFGLRYFRHFGGALAAIVVGGLITASGFALGIYERFSDARDQMLAGESFAPDGDHGVEEEEDDDGVEAPMRHASYTSSPGIPPLSADLRTRLEKLQQRYTELITARAALDRRDYDAVRRFNLRAAEYHETLAQLRAELGQPARRTK